MTATRPLRGLSILIIDDDRLGAFRLHRALARAGARVATGDLAVAEPYLGAAALAAVIVGADLNAADAGALAPKLAACPAPWIVYGDGVPSALPVPRARVARDDMSMLIETLAALCAPRRH